MRSIKSMFDRAVYILFVGVVLLFSFSPADGSIKREIMTFKSPVRISEGPGGNLLVSDYALKSVFLVSKQSGRIIRGFPVNGNPLAVAYYKDNIYIGNSSAGRVQVFSISGHVKYTFQRQVKKPNDIAIHGASKRLYVTDSQRGNVKVFTLDGEFLFKIEDDLKAPTGIVIDDLRGIVYVSSDGKVSTGIRPSIQAYNLDGSPAGAISSKKGMFGSRFSRPQGLAVNSNGYIFLVDSYSAEVLVFSGLSGNLVKTISGFGTEAGKMQVPYDIVLDQKTNDLFVTNNRLFKIEIFRNGGTL